MSRSIICEMHNPQNASPPRTGTSIGSVGIEVAPKRIILLRLISIFLSLTAAFAICSGQTKKRSAIQWNRSDCTSPVMLSDGFYDLSQFGKGQYRIDGKMSVGHFNNIYIIFQANGVLDPEIVSRVTESTFMVKDRKVMWRSYKTVVEGRAVIREAAVMPNILHPQKAGNS